MVKRKLAAKSFAPARELLCGKKLPMESAQEQGAGAGAGSRAGVGEGAEAGVRPNRGLC